MILVLQLLVGRLTSDYGICMYIFENYYTDGFENQVVGRMG